MKVKIYLKEWFFNAGLIGFLRIFDGVDQTIVKKYEDYIEFDTESLKNFHHYYFDYFMKVYNVATRMNQRIEDSFAQIENILKQEVETKQEQKAQQDSLKNAKKYIKESLKKQLDKIKKYEEDVYLQMNEGYLRLDQIKEKEDIEKLEEIKKILQDGFKKESINNKLTSNLFKSILSNQYFGQPSFLNVVKTAAPLEEQKELMYQDYVSNIVEAGFLNDILDGRYSIQEINSLLCEKLKESFLSREMVKVYQKIKKSFIDKEKNLEELQKYIQKDVLKYCCMCEEEHFLTTRYSESKFIPLALSSENAQNFFWNQEVNYPICDICKLILFCIPVGVTSITKVQKEIEKGSMVYKEREVHSFVNYGDTVLELYEKNNEFGAKSRFDKNRDNPYVKLLLHIITQEKQISEWKLSNIFVAEFEAEYGSFSRIEYFQIPTYIAKFFKRYASSTLNLIQDYRYRLQLVDCIFKGKDLKYAIYDNIREKIMKGEEYGWDAFCTTMARMYLHQLKKGEKEMESEKMEQNQKKLYALYNIGIEIHEKLKQDKADNKLGGYTYKMLNSIKAGNREAFMDTVLRLHLFIERDVSPVFLEAMQDSDFDLASIGHSFLAGLISNRYKKSETEENKIEE